MVHSSARDVALLALCQALFLTATSAVIVAAPLIGYGLAEEKVLATLPIGVQMVMMMAATVPASLLMKRIGRREGFTVGAAIGLVGALVGFWGIMAADFALFCVGTGLIGTFNGFAQYYRYAAADAASEAFKSRAISLVLAGGVIASVGPLLADWSQDLFAPIAFAGIFVAVAAIYVMTLVVLRFITIPPPDQEERSSTGRPLLQIMRQPIFIIAVLGSVVRLRHDVTADDRDPALHALLRLRLLGVGADDPVARARHVRTFVRHRSPDQALRHDDRHGRRRTLDRALRRRKP